MTRNSMGVAAAAGVAWLTVQLVRTAWVCDDSYISFRTADNIVNGYGAVWNTGERVQAFTHPLWLALFTPIYAITREPYYTSIALCMAVTLAAVFVLRRVSPTTGGFVLALSALLSSKAFIDFSTSGLENALSHLVLVSFMACWWTSDGSPRRTALVGFTASLCALTRLDLLVLVAPAVAATLYRSGIRRSLAPMAAGFAPLAAWELFSVFYYGSLVPNTAFAKLNIADPPASLMRAGWRYVHRTLITDPVTLAAGAMAIAAIAKWRRQDWPIAAGLLLYLLYVIRIGGDFMAGRFFTAPLFVSAAVLARVPMPTVRRAAVAAALVVALGLAAPWEPAIISGIGYARVDNWLHGRSDPRPRDGSVYIAYDGIMDERRYYYEGTGLLKGRWGDQRPDHPMVGDGLALRHGRERVVVRDGIGFAGYFAGPHVHIIDKYALSDPLLSRLRAPAGSRTGHYVRDIPAGYVESVALGRNVIADPEVAALYDRVRLVTAGPLWNRERWRAIVDLLLR